MRKTYPLIDQPHAPARLVERIRSDVRKYLKRERNKPLPEGSDYWDFLCQSGQTSETAKPVQLKELNRSLDQALEHHWSSLYVEVIRTPKSRTSRP